MLYPACRSMKSLLARKRSGAVGTCYALSLWSLQADNGWFLDSQMADTQGQGGDSSFRPSNSTIRFGKWPCSRYLVCPTAFLQNTQDGRPAARICSYWDHSCRTIAFVAPCTAMMLGHAGKESAFPVAFYMSRIDPLPRSSSQHLVRIVSKREARAMPDAMLPSSSNSLSRGNFRGRLNPSSNHARDLSPGALGIYHPVRVRFFNLRSLSIPSSRWFLRGLRYIMFRMSRPLRETERVARGRTRWSGGIQLGRYRSRGYVNGHTIRPLPPVVRESPIV